MTGSHRILVSTNYPQLTFWRHDGKEVTPKIVKYYLVNIVGLSVDEAIIFTLKERDIKPSQISCEFSVVPFRESELV